MWLIKREVSMAYRSDARSLKLDEDTMDVIICADGRWPRMGVILGSEALILDYKAMMSFRVQTGNLGFSPKMKIGKCRNPLNKNFLKKYFAENHDNPYGIQNIMQLIYHGRDVTDATQFPPLFLPNLTGTARMHAIERLVGLAKRGTRFFHHTDVAASLLSFASMIVLNFRMWLLTWETHKSSTSDQAVGKSIRCSILTKILTWPSMLTRPI